MRKGSRRDWSRLALGATVAGALLIPASPSSRAAGPTGAPAAASSGPPVLTEGRRADLLAGLLVPRRVRLIIRYSRVTIV